MSENSQQPPVRVGFILLGNFSMVAFTAALDVLITANLSLGYTRYEHVTIGVDSALVESDLGIKLSLDETIDGLLDDDSRRFDILLVCGGLRVGLDPIAKLSLLFRSADKDGTILGSIWNGAAALAHAGLLDERQCAIHPDNHAFMKESFPNTTVSMSTFIVEADRASCAGPVSAMEMMLKLVGREMGNDLVRAVREILSCDQSPENHEEIHLNLGDDPTLPEPIKVILELMRKNLEEPLTLQELSELSGLSRRQMERIFHSRLKSTPSRYYLELRLNQARRLLTQTNEPLVSISVACGFVTMSHFSNCYKDLFGVAPSVTRAKLNT